MFWSPNNKKKKEGGGDEEDDVVSLSEAADEATPLITDESQQSSNTTSSSSGLQFRRRAAKRESVRGSLAIAGIHDEEETFAQPVDALAPLVAGGTIVCTDGYKTSHPASTVKSLPAFVPFRRLARHRNFFLWWINEFRHWWKSSRLLVRLAGLFTLAFSLDFMDKMERVAPFKNKSRAMERNSYRALKVVKKLGQGGPMKYFLKNVHPFTRGLRILVGAWRWVESAKCRRGEVGVEETMAFIGNRVSRMVARSLVDLLVLEIVMPIASPIFKHNILPMEAWHPATLFIILGILRACSPYAASFQGSRCGRFLTRQYFKARKHRWQPIQRVQQLNLTSDDCCEKDEIDETADLAKLAKLVAKALGKGQKIGVDGMKGQAEALHSEGFRQIGAGSGGYAVYECHRRVYRGDTTGEGSLMNIILHVTPFGPSILDVMPRYIVLEFEDSVDRRAKWSEYISRKIFQGPPVLEGYCYQGAFFSPHHYAAMKVRYDKELLTYDFACKALCQTRTGRNPNPPVDQRSLKAFLVHGKRGRKRNRNARESRQLQKSVAKVTKELKSMMNGDCCAPRGVILYFEGLDCSGKSSTGGLVEQALRDAGYHVDMRQYNRPPTEAQKKKPWMDRFEIPPTTVVVAVKDDGTPDEETNDLVKKCVEHGHNALVWDRGPVGDFIYNPTFAAKPLEEKKKLYNEFIAAEKAMFEKGILFSKMLFVTNRDSIASTLGKRLAQVQMARDLKTWLQASRGGDSDLYGDIGFEGLDEIFFHIDPTDFIAFNMYLRNLRIFTNVALNTDTEENPWLVVNTGDRYAARKALLRAFSAQLQRFKARRTCCGCCPQREAAAGEDAAISEAITEAQMMEKGFSKPWPTTVILALAGILLLIFYYCEHTNFDSLVYWVSGEAFADMATSSSDATTTVEGEI